MYTLQTANVSHSGPGASTKGPAGHTKGHVPGNWSHQPLAQRSASGAGHGSDLLLLPPVLGSIVGGGGKLFRSCSSWKHLNEADSIFTLFMFLYKKI